MKLLLLTLIFFLNCSIGASLYAQSRFYKQDVVAEVTKQLSAGSARQIAALNEFCRENAVSGELVADLTVAGRGRIITVFIVSADDLTVPIRNAVQNKIKSMSFDNVKIPKKEKVKLRYTFKF